MRISYCMLTEFIFKMAWHLSSGLDSLKSLRERMVKTGPCATVGMIGTIFSFRKRVILYCMIKSISSSTTFPVEGVVGEDEGEEVR